MSQPSKERILEAADYIEEQIRHIRHHLSKGAKTPYDDIGRLFIEIQSASRMVSRRLLPSAYDSVVAAEDLLHRRSR